MKKNKYSNVLIFGYSLVVLLCSIKALFFNPGEISLITHSRLLFAYFPLVFSVIAMAISVYLLWKKPDWKWKRWINRILWFFIAVYILEYAILAIVNSFVAVSGLKKIPDRSDFLESVIFIIIDYYDDFLRGIFVTLELSLIGTGLGLVFALILVIFRTLKVEEQDGEVVGFLKKIIASLTKLYVNIFRGTPMMVQAVIIFYLFPVMIASYLNITIDQVDRFFTIQIAGITIVALNTTAYLTEVLRGGIESIDKGQLEAARSLGMGYWQSMFSVILPQAIKNSLPSIFNEFIINIKDTSVLNVIGVAELFFVTNEAQFEYYRTYEPFIIVALIYFLMTSLASLALAKIEKRLNLEAKSLPSSN